MFLHLNKPMIAVVLKGTDELQEVVPKRGYVSQYYENRPKEFEVIEVTISQTFPPKENKK